MSSSARKRREDLKINEKALAEKEFQRQRKKALKLIDDQKLDCMKEDPNVLARNKFEGDSAKLLDYKR